MSKFSGIVFPFYGKANVPSDIVYSLSTIKILDNFGQRVLVDDKELPYNDYVTRLANMPIDKRITYDYTALTLQELVNSPIKWGIDNTGKVHNLSNKERFRTKTVKINKIKDDLIWVQTVSYPFRIKNSLAEIINEYIYVTIVNIDNTWCLYKFGYKHILEREIML